MNLKGTTHNRIISRLLNGQLHYRMNPKDIIQSEIKCIIRESVYYTVHVNLESIFAKENNLKDIINIFFIWAFAIREASYLQMFLEQCLCSARALLVSRHGHLYQVLKERYLPLKTDSLF